MFKIIVFFKMTNKLLIQKAKNLDNKRLWLLLKKEAHLGGSFS